MSTRFDDPHGFHDKEIRYPYFAYLRHRPDFVVCFTGKEQAIVLENGERGPAVARSFGDKFKPTFEAQIHNYVTVKNPEKIKQLKRQLFLTRT